MACCGGTITGDMIKDVPELKDPLLADRDHIYRLPDSSLWILNQKDDGYQQFNKGSMLHVADKNSIDLEYDLKTNTLTGTVKKPWVDAVVAEAISGASVMFSVDGSTPVPLMSVEVIND